MINLSALRAIKACQADDLVASGTRPECSYQADLPAHRASRLLLWPKNLRRLQIEYQEDGDSYQEKVLIASTSVNSACRVRAEVGNESLESSA